MINENGESMAPAWISVPVIRCAYSLINLEREVGLKIKLVAQSIDRDGEKTRIIDIFPLYYYRQGHLKKLAS
jgi:hypothetical protein